MPHQTEHEIITALERAIQDKHAVTLSLGGRSILADPLSLSRTNGKLILTYWNNEAGTVQRHMVQLVKEVIDLGRSLEEITAP